jgi:hypothetical protein
MEELPTTVRHPVRDEPQKRGPKPKVPWADNLKQKIEQRLWLGKAKDSLDAECKFIADEYNAARKIRAPGDDDGTISYQRLRALYCQDHIGGAEHYSRVRKERLDMLLEAGRAFLTMYQPWK